MNDSSSYSLQSCQHCRHSLFQQQRRSNRAEEVFVECLFLKAKRASPHVLCSEQQRLIVIGYTIAVNSSKDRSIRLGDVFIHPSATIHSTAVIGPNVSVGEGVRIGSGVRVCNSIVLSGAELKVICFTTTGNAFAIEQLKQVRRLSRRKSFFAWCPIIKD